jgi:hypothetical protein
VVSPDGAVGQGAELRLDDVQVVFPMTLGVRLEVAQVASADEAAQLAS